MLKFLRKKQNIKIGLWIISIIIIVTFVFWGAKTSVQEGKKRPNYAGTIKGKKVGMEIYAQSYRACYNQALMQYGQEELAKIIEYLNLDEQAWNRIILLKEAERRKIKTTNEEVIETIKGLEVFQEEGKFDQKRYEAIITRYLKSNPRMFEEDMRQSTTISKLIEEVIGNINLSGDELIKMYKEENEELKTAYILFEPENFKDQVEPKDKEIEKYYNENKEEFKTNPQVNIEYLPVTVNLTKDEVEVTEEELKDYYETHLDLFKKEVKEETEEKEAEYKDFAEVKKDIEIFIVNEKAKELALDITIEIQQKIAEGAEFNKAAIDYSVIMKETDYFSAFDSIPEIGWNYQFLNTAFSLKPQVVSDIIELPNGYYILRLKDKKASYIPEYEEIKDKVKEAYINKEAFSLAKKEAEKNQKLIKEDIAKGKTFKEAVESLSLKAQLTEFFKRNSDYVTGIGKSPDFVQSAFSLKEKEVSEPVKAPKGYSLIAIEELKPIDEETFTKDKEEFKKKALNIKKMEKYQNWFENIRKEADTKSFM